jgi:hypothetical protein
MRTVLRERGEGHIISRPIHLPACLFSLSLAVFLHGLLHVGEELCLLLGGSSDGLCGLFGGTAQGLGLLPERLSGLADGFTPTPEYLSHLAGGFSRVSELLPGMPGFFC